MKRTISIITCVLAISASCFSQDKEIDLQRILRINVFGPSVEIELPIGQKSTFAINTGVKINGSYSWISYNGLTSTKKFYINPFAYISYKKFYNLKRRISKNKSIDGNAGNYWGLRQNSYFNYDLNSSQRFFEDAEFTFGPVWGMQRSSGAFHFLFDIGPAIGYNKYKELEIYPLMFQINIGWNFWHD